MQLEVGKVYDGKVTGIAKIGAFVEVEGKTGMVHISEISNTFVEDIKDHLTIGQEVKVKVINITEEGKISLSIKKALPRENRQPRGQAGQQRSQDRGDRQSYGGKGGHSDKQGSGRRKGSGQRKDAGAPPPLFDPDQPKDSNFEDMLSRFKQASEEKFSDLKRITDSKRRTGARRK